jgi:hypothetical protein
MHRPDMSVAAAPPVHSVCNERHQPGRRFVIADPKHEQRTH